MKHVALISKEFVKEAKWDDLSVEKQREYLSRHPGSKRRVVGRPDQKVWGKDWKMLRFETDGDAREAVEYLKGQGVDVERGKSKMSQLKFVNDAERKKALELLYKHKLYKMLKS